MFYLPVDSVMNKEMNTERLNTWYGLAYYTSIRNSFAVELFKGQ